MPHMDSAGCGSAGRQWTFWSGFRMIEACTTVHKSPLPGVSGSPARLTARSSRPDVERMAPPHPALLAHRPPSAAATDRLPVALPAAGAVASAAGAGTGAGAAAHGGNAIPGSRIAGGGARRAGLPERSAYAAAGCHRLAQQRPAEALAL